MEAHPIADLFPMLHDDELRELADDIATRGLDHPIVVDDQGRVLDGRNRLAACELAEVEPTYETYRGDDPDGYALANNVHRRHLSTGARAVIIEQARRMNGQTKRAASEIADLLHHQRLTEAAQVIDYAPDLAAQVVTGVWPLSRAVEEARNRKREAEAHQAKLDRLDTDASDLAAAVRDGEHDIDEAIARLEHRLRVAEEQRLEQERLERERLAEEERLAAERRAQRESELRAARANLTSVLTYLTSDSIPPAELAADYVDIVDEFNANDLTFAAQTMQHIATLRTETQ